MWRMTDEQKFGPLIRALRKERLLDQRTLAERVEARLLAQGGRGFDVTYLSKIENTRVGPPSTAAIIALAEELGADADQPIALAGKVPPVAGEALRMSPGAWIFLRSTLDLSLTEQDWQGLIEDARRRKGLT